MGNETKKKEKTGFEKDHAAGVMGSMNGMPLNKAVIKLIETRNDLRNYVSKKPTSTGFDLDHVKEYFGIKGTGKTLLSNFMKVFAEYRNK